MGPDQQAARSRSRLIAALDGEEYARLAPHLVRVRLDTRQVLFELDLPIEHVYFPETAIASVVSVMADGSAVETATIGNEGMVGLPVFLGADRMAAQAFCQVPGDALRLPVGAFRAALASDGQLSRLLNLYTQALFTLVAQSSACNRLHTARERCARWLLLCHDRVDSDSFPLTHTFLAQMLGVRRATVTETAGALQRDGLIGYRQGVITILARDGLERAACECYGTIRRELDRLLGPPGEPLGWHGGRRHSQDGMSTVGPPESSRPEDVE